MLSAVVTSPILSVSAVILELLVTPAPSTLDRVMFKMFFTVVEAIALPVNIVPPNLLPVPSVEVATIRIGTVAKASVEVALTSTIGRVSSGPGGGAPSVMFSKSVLSVSDSEGSIIAEVVEEVENVDGSIIGGGVESAGGGVSAGGEPVGGVEVAVSAPLGVDVAVSGVLVDVPGSVVVATGSSGRGATKILNIEGVAILPAESVAVHSTTVEPIANVESDAGVQVATPTPSTLSLVAGGV